MHEIVLNLHLHTRYSDGGGSHRDIAAAAAKCSLDAVLVTDHNVLVPAMRGYYREGARRVLMLVGEEVHDRNRDPQKNHLLVFGAQREMAGLAAEPESLMRSINDAGGLSFIAHPTDPAARAFGEADISWVDWSNENFTGIEVWNGFSELKNLIPTKLHGLLYAFFPALVAHGPPEDTLRKWDELTLARRVVGIGGSDAHALPMRMGPLHRVVYPYVFHFRTINTHVLLGQPLEGEAARDEQTIYAAMAAGRCFIGYDLPFPTRGFRFTAPAAESETTMGDEVSVRGGVTLQVHLPSFAEIRLLRNGKAVKTAAHAQALTWLAMEPGAYRVEVYRRYRGRRRGWIFSNPIYIR